MNVSHKFLWITFGRVNVFYHITSRPIGTFLSSVEWAFSTLPLQYLLRGMASFHNKSHFNKFACLSLEWTFSLDIKRFTAQSRVSRWNKRVPQTLLDSIILHVYTIQLSIAIIHWHFYHKIVAPDPSHKHSKIHIFISRSQTNVHNSDSFQRTSVGNLDFLIHALQYRSIFWRKIIA